VVSAYRADPLGGLGLQGCKALPLIGIGISYRKQIMRQLRTQYVEGIHRPKYYRTGCVVLFTG